MNTNREESRKRKTNEVVGESSNPGPSDNRIDYFALRGHPHVIPPGVPHVPLFQSTETSRAQLAHNMASHAEPFSYQHLLNGPDPEGYLRSFVLSENRNTTSQPIGQIIALHGEILKNELSSLVEKLAEAKAENILKDKELELTIQSNKNNSLEMKAELYRNQAEDLVKDVKEMEETASLLRKKIKEANERMYAEAAQENVEYSYVDQIALGPVWLTCRACGKQVATVMMMPCRHISVCPQCQDVTMCPLCGETKVDCVEAYLPYK